MKTVAVFLFLSLFTLVPPLCKGESVPLRVVMDDNYPPFVFRSPDGRLQGILVDQWRLWEKKTGVPVEIRGMEWNRAVREMESGTHDVIDHRQPLAQALRAQTGLAQVELVASLTQTDQHFPHIVELLAPQGRLALIDDPQAIDIRALKQKSISLHWESMFTRSLFQTADMPVQGQLLATVAQLVDAGRIRSTQRQHLGRITAENLRQAHVLQESGTSIGKTVLEGF